VVKIQECSDDKTGCTYEGTVLLRANWSVGTGDITPSSRDEFSITWGFLSSCVFYFLCTPKA
jgi:hypothetical protein